MCWAQPGPHEPGKNCSLGNHLSDGGTRSLQIQEPKQAFRHHSQHCTASCLAQIR